VTIYGDEMGARAMEELNKIENDPAIANEKKAAALLESIRAEYKTAGRDKTTKSLLKLIADYPDTTAATNASKTLKHIGM
jgi:hypothetical protein